MKRMLTATVLCMLAVLVTVTNHALDKHRTPERALQETLYLPDGDVLRTASLGYTSLLADILWIKSVLYYGRNSLDEDNPFYRIIQQGENQQNSDAVANRVRLNGLGVKRDDWIDFSRDVKLARHHGDRDYNVANFIFPLLERVSNLEPHFLATYEFGGLVLLKRTGAVEAAQRLLSYGLEMNPNRWELPFFLGYIDLFYTGNNTSALKWLKSASSYSDSPGFVKHLYGSMTANQNNPDIYIKYLKGLYHSTNNESVRKNILSALRKLQGRPQIAAE